MLLMKIVAASVSVALAAGLLTRDRDLTANRLIAAFLLCNAFWATCEFYLLQTQDPAVAVVFYRWMTMGWMPLGLLCMHASLNLTSMPNHPISRTIPVFYCALAIVSVLSINSDWIISGVATRNTGGWRGEFGTLFPIAYVLMSAPVVIILVVWRRLMVGADRDGEDELARIIFFGVSISLVSGTLTAVVLPFFNIHAITMTTSLLSFVGLLVAWTLRRFGHSLISPEAFAREIFDTLDDGIVVLGENGVVRDSNRAFGRMIGVGSNRAVGLRITNWIPDFPEQVESFDASTFLEIRQESGSRLPVVISPPVKMKARRHLAGHVYVIRDRREVTSLQRQLAVSGRLAAVGDLSKSISESIHAPAAATQANLERLAADWQAMLNWLEATGKLEESREAVLEGLELIDECVEGIDRVTSIVQEVGSFSADFSHGSFVRHRLSEIVECAVRIARTQAKPNVDIEIQLDPDIEIMCHRSELERVVTNILVNAIHALDGMDRDVSHLSVAVGAQGDRALLHIEDDGCGIESNVLDRIFDPFFTTKPVGRGTGLGLAISYHIVRKHGGQIRVSSIADRGTSVAVELPRLMDGRAGNAI